ncbi:hypothetical protein [Chlorobium phaeovibrioides]|uniref:hypothetical protein n=1 Tax=Chlorobium phaeovibrioides TaxID=1094 RepID=UPI0016395F83|nr:hypothetical protein [Chlorobium phaeovibrioides]
MLPISRTRPEEAPHASVSSTSSTSLTLQALGASFLAPGDLPLPLWLPAPVLSKAP